MANETAAADLAAIDVLLAETDKTDKADRPAIPVDAAGLPVIQRHPVLVAAVNRLAELRADLAAAESRAKGLAVRLGMSPGDNARVAKARALVRDALTPETLKVFEELAAAQETIGVFADAIALAENAVNAAREKAGKEYTRVALDTVYLLARQRLCRAWLAYVAEANRYSDVIAAGHAAGVAVAGGWDGSIPTATADRPNMVETAVRMVQAGHLTHGEVDAVPHLNRYLSDRPTWVAQRKQ